MDWLEHRLPDDAKVLEIGPGHSPFRRADTFVDFVDVPTIPKDKLVKCDMAKEKLPFEDKSFDFVLCRHMLEDMFNPFHVCEEMSRVAKAGYIETPSPIAELTRGVDGGAPQYRGYHHHRFIVWEWSGQLNFVSKYPVVEYLNADDEGNTRSLRAGPNYWNTYYLWKDRVNVRHRQSPLDYDIPREYQPLLNTAAVQSKAATDMFFDKMRSAHGD